MGVEAGEVKVQVRMVDVVVHLESLICRDAHLVTAAQVLHVSWDFHVWAQFLNVFMVLPRKVNVTIAFFIRCCIFEGGCRVEIRVFNFLDLFIMRILKLI